MLIEVLCALASTRRLVAFAWPVPPVAAHPRDVSRGLWQRRWASIPLRSARRGGRPTRLPLVEAAGGDRGAALEGAPGLSWRRRVRDDSRRDCRRHRQFAAERRFDEVGKSVLGGLAGAILAIEIIKWRRGIAGSTGLCCAAPLAAAMAVAGLGCFLPGSRTAPMEPRPISRGVTIWRRHHAPSGAALRSCHDGLVPRRLRTTTTTTTTTFARRLSIGDPSRFYFFIGAYAGQRFP